jgi:isoleucyl-tRNA synthetase
VYHSLLDFCTVELSAIYLDILKDRLYCDGADSKGRRAAQTVMWNILLGLLKFMAPVITFSAEEIWRLIRREGMPESIHMANFPDDKQHAEDAELLEKWDNLLKLRSSISKALEEARRKKIIGSSQEAKVTLSGDGELLKLAGQDLNLVREITISSAVEIIAKPDDAFIKPEETDGLMVKIEHASGKKCQRCWNWSTDVGPHGAHEEICDRCADVLMSFK